MRQKIIFLIGPTAVGKTEIAIKLAQKIGAEIISCDSMQIYKGMDIISAKPNIAQRRKLCHHLIDSVSPEKEYDCIKYQKDVLAAIKLIHKKGKIPLIVGGTGFYMSVLLDGIFEGVAKDEGLRKKLYKESEDKGAQRLFLRLKKLDKLSASRIHQNDIKRIVRALEVAILTGQPISKLQKNRKGVLGDYEVKIFGLRKNRVDLYTQIDKRVDLMFKKGLVKEVKGLLKKKLNKTASQAIGIKEIKGYLEGKYDLTEAKRLVKRNSRRYAKRQFTWFNRDTRIEWIDIDHKIINKIVEEII